MIEEVCPSVRLFAQMKSSSTCNYGVIPTNSYVASGEGRVEHLKPKQSVEFLVFNLHGFPRWPDHFFSSESS